ncbi:MAG: VOC family protein [Solirubrobacteraceae bacterium]
MQARAARIGHIGVTVRDLDATVEFYSRYVGLRLTERFEYPADEVGHGVLVTAGAFMRAGSDHHCVSFFAPKHGVESSTQGDAMPYGLHHIAFEMRTPEELLSKYRDLREAGVQIVNARSGGPGNQPRFYARDPDGNMLEFYWSIDQIGWQGSPRAYPDIQAIDLEAFDFEAFVQERERAAAAALASDRTAVPDGAVTDAAVTAGGATAPCLQPEPARQPVCANADPAPRAQAALAPIERRAPAR